MESTFIYIIVSLLIGFGLGYYIAMYNSRNLLASQEKNLDQEKEKLDQIKKELENWNWKLGAGIAEMMVGEWWNKFQYRSTRGSLET